MELLLSSMYQWLRIQCSYIAHSVGASKGVKINADDLFVDTVAKAIRLQSNYTDQGKTLKPWLKTIAINQAITMGNKLKKQALKHVDTNVVNQDGDEMDLMDNMENPELAGISLEDDLISRANIEQINACIDEMSPVFRDVIRLSIVEGRTYAEIAKILDIPQNTVSSRHSRGREELTLKLKDLAAEFGIHSKKKEK